MNHREYLKEMINEAPIAYDDETTSKIGTYNDETDTVWGKAPGKKATQDQVLQWIMRAKKKNILKTTNDYVLGRGSSRTCVFNDGKAVFKFNHGTPFGNQTKAEMKIWKKWGSKYQDILARIYIGGDNWYIAEKAKEFDKVKFQKSTGCSWEEFEQFTDKISNQQLKSAYKSKKSMYEAIRSFEGSANGMYENLADSPVLCRMFEFCINSGSKMVDLHDQNLGFRDNDLIIIDFGFVEGANSDY